MNSPVLQYDDIQGTILRGYRVDLARHFVLSIRDPASAGRFIRKLVTGQDGLPRVTTAERWLKKPSGFLNIGFTCPGLAALGVGAEQLASFDPAFQLGATNAASASAVGDVGDSSPAQWIGGLADGGRVHVLLSLWVAKDPALLESLSARLRQGFADGFSELSAHDAQALPDNQVHFGYRDSIAQPTIAGAPARKRQAPDDQEVVATGEFLLGYLNQSGGVYTVKPEQLSRNGSYAAFRILEQDVAGFDAFLNEYAAKAGIDPELLAAKVCGRWRNGNPLTLRPDEAGATLPADQLNDFNYVNSQPSQDDTLGLKCPIGSHIRRNNPRNGAVVGTDSAHHRIVRRAMPYGPAYDPLRPTQAARGLIGYFINASLRNQFEFLSGQWSLLSDFVKSATEPGNPDAGNAVFNISGEDVFLGVNNAADSSFTLAAPGRMGKNNTVLKGFSRMITTRGGAYCFFPGIGGLRYLADLAAP
ncbi:peroxidase [Chromobacterium haemolyticum]|uniref:Peroxidase n=1 Tax=Chromobacterium fluminis TaxID=3044269 RepID=A0ABX0L7G4_9NEIS|nr:peroxidase [Chromobacterium haemolyticum]NHR07749.1 peroxidase [Chromobacterium haemolyticum]